ncbi:MULTISPECIES: response regulator transcription factor [unclassified Bacillus (in: firmicutes)]|uniref:response regulator transcription factor n=1 Tax=unclassified Bacillus (in: firmicutes) TaxID=185979 RepID=UPI000BEFC74F|nr:MULTISPECIES: response regulator transcription factor [unclassified Bacillus (in: firmicutes)]PEJ59075.1 DNA-binding response regulator [Bacillus sp. AFS002410]PEK99056.1 DNA-binding response regulator [Bacillus sp. AFS017336]
MNDSVNILVVEDDEDINRLLCDIIVKNGFIPKAAYSGTEALIHLEIQNWDLVLLDLMLPGLSGEELLKKITEETNIPVMIISAKLEMKTKIDILRSGADDYITKPFDIEEVSARIESCLRRYRRIAKITVNNQIRHKDLLIDLDLKKVSVNEIELKLTAIEYQILCLLLSSPNKVFTKANLFESVWHEEFYGDDNTINVHMSNIRSKLTKANPTEEYIETIWGMGYRLKT